MYPASFYKPEGGKSVRCFLCRHNCLIKDGKLGLCMVRENKGGKLFSIFYGRPCAVAIDPIEKKPLFHFYPSTKSFSLATLGCNFQCEFCQNWDISQFGRMSSSVAERPVAKIISPEEIVSQAGNASCKTISYTYSEPTIFYEYARDIAKLAKPRGIENVFVTNGFMSREMLGDAGNWLAAANVDLKAFKDSTYKKVMKGNLKGVLDSIMYMKELGIWIEITTLIVPQMNDSASELSDIAEFIAKAGKDIPWHISRFYPQYKMSNKQPTPHKTMRMAHEIGKKAGLKYVYMGNVEGDETENTYCWNCGKKIIERFGFSVSKKMISDEGSCLHCKAKIDWVF